MTGSIGPGPGDGEHTLEDASGVVTLQCAGGVDQLLRRVVGLVAELGLEVFAVIDHSGEAAEVGIDMPDTKLVIFGNARNGSLIMLAHPLIALDLPLKLLIWESPGGHVFVTYHALTELAGRYRLSEQEVETLRIVERVAGGVASG